MIIQTLVSLYVKRVWVCFFFFFPGFLDSLLNKLVLENLILFYPGLTFFVFAFLGVGSAS